MAVICMRPILFREFALTQSAAVALCLTKLHEQFWRKSSPQEASVVVESALQLRVGVKALTHTFFCASLYGRLCKIICAPRDRFRSHIKLPSFGFAFRSSRVGIYSLPVSSDLLRRQVFYPPQRQNMLAPLPVVTALIRAVRLPLSGSAFFFFHVGDCITSSKSYRPRTVRNAPRGTWLAGHPQLS